MKKAEYKIICGETGFSELEKKISKMLNEGWKPLGGIVFNAGYPYQTMAKITTTNKKLSTSNP